MLGSLSKEAGSLCFGIKRFLFSHRLSLWSSEDEQWLSIIFLNEAAQRGMQLASLSFPLCLPFLDSAVSGIGDAAAAGIKAWLLFSVWESCVGPCVRKTVEGMG